MELLLRVAIHIFSIFGVTDSFLFNGIQTNFTSQNGQRTYFRKLTCAKSTMTIHCPVGFIIQIREAVYGRLRHVDPCHTYFHEKLCISPDAEAITKSICQGFQHCIIHVNASIFNQDPCPNLHKYLEVTYTCEDGGPLPSTLGSFPNTKASNCQSVMADVVFLMDSSESESTYYFQKQVEFVAGFARAFRIGPKHMQISVLTFSTAVLNQFTLNQYNNTHDLERAIHRIKYKSGATKTNFGLNAVGAYAFQQSHGDRPNAPNVLVVLTDGKSKNPYNTSFEAQNLRNMGITIFAVGIGDRISTTELREIAGDTDNIFVITGFDILYKFQLSLENAICKALEHTSFSSERSTKTTRPSSMIASTTSSSLTSSSNNITGNCRNHVETCGRYGQEICHTFKAWAEVQCPLYCEFCKPSSIESSSSQAKWTTFGKIVSSINQNTIGISDSNPKSTISIVRTTASTILTSSDSSTIQTRVSSNKYTTKSSTLKDQTSSSQRKWSTSGKALISTKPRTTNTPSSHLKSTITIARSTFSSSLKTSDTSISHTTNVFSSKHSFETSVFPVSTKNNVARNHCYQCGDKASGISCTKEEVLNGISSLCQLDEFCQTDINVDLNGAQHVYKRCVNEHTCSKEWLLLSSDKEYCVRFGRVVPKKAYSCSFCCNKPNCNSGLIPSNSTLYGMNS